MRLGVLSQIERRERERGRISLVHSASIGYHIIIGLADKVHCEPYHELPMSITRLRALVQFRLGSHYLPVEQGRFVRPSLPRHLRRCDLCNTQAVGDELHYVFDCPRFGTIRAQYSICFRLLKAPCVCTCGIRTKRLLAFASQPFCKWPRHGTRIGSLILVPSKMLHDPVSV